MHKQQLSEKSGEYAVVSWLALAAAVISLLTIIIRVEPSANDDTYIYFNYVRNFVDGRPFAYDGRNIPSEGFTSLLYVLLLVPFEAAGINMMFAAASLNFIGIALIIWLGYRLVRADKLAEGSFCKISTILFALLLANDANIPVIVGRGLETMLGPASILWAVFHFVRVHSAENRRERLRALNLFFLASLISYFVRPENLALLGCVGLLLPVKMWRQRELVPLIIRLGAFLVILVALATAKLLFFGDIWPTGYYRKMHAEGGGIRYVLGAIRHYKPWLLSLLLILTITGILHRRKFRPQGQPSLLQCFLKPSVLALSIVAAGTLILFIRTEPLIGYAYRYLVNTYVVLYFFIAVAGSRLISSIYLSLRHRVQAWIPACTVGLFGSCLLLFSECKLGDIPSRLRFYHRAELSTAQHQYVTLGEFLRDRIPRIEHLTFVCGDAGAFPYTMRCRFIDSNGLTEPFIARLFAEDNSPEKTKLFSNYILSWNPDVIVIASGRIDKDGRWTPPFNRHSPFRGRMPISVFEDLKCHGIDYVCSIHAYYDLHFGVRRDSEYFGTATKALQDYAKERGYVLENGLTVTRQGRDVHFSRAAP